jgi:glycosyltransferase involved in cell wall biosynthesis
MQILAVFPAEPEDWQILDQIPPDCLSSILVVADVMAPVGLISSDKVRKAASAEFQNALREALSKSRPDIVLWFGRLCSIQAWKSLRQLVRCAPEALLIVAAGQTRSQGGFLEDVVLRIGLWFRVVDSVVFCSGKARTLCKVNPQRCTVLHCSGRETVTALLEKRLLAHHKSVLWVDPNITAQSPSMRSLVDSIHALRAEGWSVCGLCYEHPQDNSVIDVTRLPRLPLPRLLDLLQFVLCCNLYRFIQSRLFRRRPATIVHTTCGYDLLADLVSVHFCQQRWLDFSSTLGVRSLRDRVALQLSRIYSVVERLQLRCRHARLALPVSRAIGEAVREAYGTTVPQVVLPNAFDESRFGIETRNRYRDAMRSKLGFGDNVTVFAFTSYGHYRRKGFWLIVDALRILQDRDDLRLLVIGGSPQGLERLKRDLLQSFPGYLQAIVFVGMTDQVERFLAAADAFIFPSYFEAFSLAEIEAAAIGLPLLVTRHPGTEMIVRPGKNGLFLEADPADIADKMQRFAAKEFAFELPDTGEALTREQFAQRIASIYERYLSSEVRVEGKRESKEFRGADFHRSSNNDEAATTGQADSQKEAKKKN